jgi:hypothetical protein
MDTVKSHLPDNARHLAATHPTDATAGPPPTVWPLPTAANSWPPSGAAALPNAANSRTPAAAAPPNAANSRTTAAGAVGTLSAAATVPLAWGMSGTGTRPADCSRPPGHDAGQLAAAPLLTTRTTGKALTPWPVASSLPRFTAPLNRRVELNAICGAHAKAVSNPSALDLLAAAAASSRTPDPASTAPNSGALDATAAPPTTARYGLRGRTPASAEPKSASGAAASNLAAEAAEREAEEDDEKGRAEGEDGEHDDEEEQEEEEGEEGWRRKRRAKARAASRFSRGPAKSRTAKKSASRGKCSSAGLRMFCFRDLFVDQIRRAVRAAVDGPNYVDSDSESDTLLPLQDILAPARYDKKRKLDGNKDDSSHAKRRRKPQTDPNHNPKQKPSEEPALKAPLTRDADLIADLRKSPEMPTMDCKTAGPDLVGSAVKSATRAVRTERLKAARQWMMRTVRVPDELRHIQVSLLAVDTFLRQYLEQTSSVFEDVGIDPNDAESEHRVLRNAGISPQDPVFAEAEPALAEPTPALIAANEPPPATSPAAAAAAADGAAAVAARQPNTPQAEHAPRVVAAGGVVRLIAADQAGSQSAVSGDAESGSARPAKTAGHAVEVASASADSDRGPTAVGQRDGDVEPQAGDLEGKAGTAVAAQSPSSDTAKSKPPKKRVKITPMALYILMRWLCTNANMRSPYPSPARTRRLAVISGLPESSVDMWFVNARQRIVKPWWKHHSDLLPGKVPPAQPHISSLPQPGTQQPQPQPNQPQPPHLQRQSVPQVQPLPCVAGAHSAPPVPPPERSRTAARQSAQTPHSASTAQLAAWSPAPPQVASVPLAQNGVFGQQCGPGTESSRPHFPSWPAGPFTSALSPQIEEFATALLGRPRIQTPTPPLPSQISPIHHLHISADSHALFPSSHAAPLPPTGVIVSAV